MAAYDYAAATGYARSRSNWIDYPNVTTPVLASHTNRWDQAIADLKGLTFNVKDYQAVGDGATNDSTAIQAADTDAAAVGGIVCFPKATYAHTSVLRPSAGVTWFGPGATLKSNVTVADPNTGNKSSLSIGRGGSCELIGLTLNGNSATQVGIELAGYSDGQIQNFLGRDLKVTGFTQAGVKIQGGYRHTFDRCKIYSNQIGVWVPPTAYLASLGQFDFHSCWLHDNTAEGVYMQRGDIVNFFGGNVENNGTYGFHFDPSASGQFLTSIGIYGVNIEANHTMGLLAHDFTQGIVAVGNQFAASAIQPQAWQLDGGGGGNHTFIGNYQTGHTNASVNSSANSTIIPGRLFSEPAITGNTQPIYSKPTVTGSKGANAALTSLMTALVTLGLVTDSTT